MKREQIVCHSFPSWDAPYIKSTMELMKELASMYDVLILDYSYTWKDVFLNKNAPAKAILGCKSRLRKVKLNKIDEIHILSQPPIFPTNAIRWSPLTQLLEGLNKRLLQRFTKKWLFKLQIENPILINALNPVRGLQLHPIINPKFSIYYCYDNIAAMAWAKTKGLQAEASYIRKVDSVITSSSGLAKRLKKTKDNLHIVHNGYNDKVFHGHLKKVNNRNIDYLGAVDDRLNISLIQKVCRILPDYQFRFIGPIKDKRIKEQLIAPNLRFYNNIPQQEAAEMLRNSSVCIIPFLTNEFTKSIYPLKINEYLAMGKPVVTTAFADLSEFRDLIAIANNSQVFAAVLLHEVETDHIALQQARISFAKSNTWRNRALDFHQVIDQALFATYRSKLTA